MCEKVGSTEVACGDVNCVRNRQLQGAPAFPMEFQGLGDPQTGEVTLPEIVRERPDGDDSAE